MRRLAGSWERILVVFGVLAAADSASAQHIINLSSGGAERIYTGAADSRAGTWLDHGTIGAGDARRDLVIGAPGGTSGRVYILFGRPPGNSAPLETYADAIVTGPVSFGSATAIGNVTGTATGTSNNLIVGAPDAASGRGQVFVFSRDFQAGDRLTHSAAVAVITGAPNDRIGSAMATADLDFDGTRELIIGAPGTDRVYVLYGPVTGAHDLSSGADSVIVGHPSNGSGIGRVLLAGPLTGDSIYDLVIGEPAANSVYLVGGTDDVRLPARVDLPASASDPSLRPAGVTAMFSGPDAGDEAGTVLVVADLDGNSVQDLVIGAPGGDGQDNTQSNAGEVHVLWNEQTGTSRSLAESGVVFYGGQANQHTGSVIAKGDINRDTPNDLVFRMHYGTGGEVRVFYGRDRGDIGQSIGGRRVVNFANPFQEDRIIINDATTSLLTSLFIFEVTGEGARDVVIADANAVSGAGQVFLTISPRMIPSQPSVSVTLGEGQTATANINVVNASAITLPWTANGAPASWMTVTPNSGSSNSAQSDAFAVQTSTAGLAPGTYSSNVQLKSASVDLMMTVAIPVTMTVQETRFVTIDSPASGSNLPGGYTVTGWAIDKSAPTGTGVDRVDIYALPTGGGARRFLGTASYTLPRPTVGTQHGGRFANSGFSLNVDTPPGGTYRLVAEARSSVDAAIWTKPTGTVTVTSPGSSNAFDLNGDGFTDLIWQNTGTRAVVYWSMNGLNMVAGGAAGPGALPDGRWEVRTLADMNGDGHADVVLQELNTGELRVWLLSGSALLQSVNLQTLGDPAWRLSAAADLNADGRIDLVFQHLTQGYVAVWLMNGTALQEAKLLNPSRVNDLAWKIIGAGDVNRDGHPDLIWQNDNSRVLTSWLMNGTTMTRGGPFTVTGPTDLDWQARGAADINGDGSVDLLWQNVRYGYIAAWLMDGQTFLDAKLLNPNRVNMDWLLGGPR